MARRGAWRILFKKGPSSSPSTGNVGRRVTRRVDDRNVDDRNTATEIKGRRVAAPPAGPEEHETVTHRRATSTGIAFHSNPGHAIVERGASRFEHADDPMSLPRY
ncbi:hypothetical protein L1787_22060 [Acuticoccus sp. M5D2P5]|uniref:hypothetical protein n=1 Tax=Acuticoccus kalidii TaxID=2910977 RepID=UPI001F42804E|nr:hypothetical protein [Acuticoccus kalidii]MCF3936079.1 hypothetical protein [Acuticoccus kalidii]